MSNKQMRKQRWARLNRMKKHRVNLFYLEQKVNRIASQQELEKLESEQTLDLLSALEQKIQRLKDEVKVLRYKLILCEQKATERSFWWKVKQVLRGR